MMLQGRRGCDFLDGAAECMTFAEEDSGSMEQEIAVGHVQFIVGRDQDSWQQKIATGRDVDRLQRKIATSSFLPQRITAGCD
ncbi:hypothetical protein BHM03_00041105 [Ensete ventricosum]|nr:hypothetical protein BHM03_00041105 [Ensete ventricosum]